MTAIPFSNFDFLLSAIYEIHYLEEKQQTTLTEWYSAQDDSKPESQRQRAIPNVAEEYDLLDDGGDTVFSQLVQTFISILRFHIDGNIL